MTRSLGITVAGAVLLASSLARAQNVEVGVYAGWHIFSSDNELGAVEGEEDNIVKDSYLGGFRVGFVLHPRLSIEGEGSIIPTKNEANSDDGVFVFGYRAHLAVTLTPASMGPKLFAVAGGGGLTSLGSDSKDIATDTDVCFHLGLGAKIPMGAAWGLRFDGRVLFPPTTAGENGFTTDFEVTLGAYKRFGEIAAPVEKKEEAQGPIDTDGDGLVDDIDSCVTEQEDLDSFLDTDGCPDPDNDNDGVLDGDDACKEVAEDKDKFEDGDGCPEDDNDKDGVTDANEACDNEAEDPDGFEDTDGCPDPDNDGDGVLDKDDNCDEQAETRNGFKDGDGCPDDLPPEVKKLTGVALKGVEFSSKQAKLKKGSSKTLDEVAKVLAQYGEVRFEIQGHTDELKKREDNVALSQARAKAVKKYLVDKGIAADRLTAVGYGPDKPGAKKSANRRIELQVMAPAGPGGAAEGSGPRENDL